LDKKTKHKTEEESLFDSKAFLLNVFFSTKSKPFNLFSLHSTLPLSTLPPTMSAADSRQATTGAPSVPHRTATSYPVNNNNININNNNNMPYYNNDNFNYNDSDKSQPRFNPRLTQDRTGPRASLQAGLPACVQETIHKTARDFGDILYREEKARQALKRLEQDNIPKSLRVNVQASFSKAVDSKFTDDFKKLNQEHSEQLKKVVVQAKMDEITKLTEQRHAGINNCLTYLKTLATSSFPMTPKGKEKEDEDMAAERTHNLKRLRTHTIDLRSTAAQPTDAAAAAAATEAAAAAAPMDTSQPDDCDQMSALQLHHLHMWVNALHEKINITRVETTNRHLKEVEERRIKADKFEKAKQLEEELTVDAKIQALVERRVQKEVEKALKQAGLPQGNTNNNRRGRSNNNNSNNDNNNNNRTRRNASRSRRRDSSNRRSNSRPGSRGRSQQRSRSQSNSRQRRPNGRRAGSAPRKRGQGSTQGKGRGKNVRFSTEH
jgi:hypothetical protein